MRPAEFLSVRPVSCVQAQPISWLWPGHLARGKLSIVGGPPGTNKSTVAASITAIVTTGGQWPVTRDHCQPPGDVILIAGEDDLADTVRPRLEAAGADLDRVHFADGVAVADGSARLRPWTIANDLRLLEQQIRAVEAALVVIDPISQFLGSGVDSHSMAEVRAVLDPLCQLAGDTGAAVLAITHLNKSGTMRDALSRFTGSMGFVAAARSVWAVARHPDDPQRRLFLPAKNNIGNDTQGYSFEAQSVTLDSGIQTVRVVWGGRHESISADELLCAAGDPEIRTEKAEAVRWLEELLADGEMPAKDVQRAANDAGLAWRTVQRAMRKAGVAARRQGFPAVTVWTRATTGATGTPHIYTGATGATGATTFTRGLSGGAIGATEQLRQLRQSCQESNNGRGGAAVGPVIEAAARKAGVPVDLLLDNLSQEDLSDSELMTEDALARYAMTLSEAGQ